MKIALVFFLISAKASAMTETYCLSDQMLKTFTESNYTCTIEVKVAKDEEEQRVGGNCAQEGEEDIFLSASACDEATAEEAVERLDLPMARSHCYIDKKSVTKLKGGIKLTKILGQRCFDVYLSYNAYMGIVTNSIPIVPAPAN